MTMTMNGAARWTRDNVIQAIQDHAATYGQPPVVNGWQQANDNHPSHTTVKKLFGSWNAGIAAAGFPTRQRGGAPGPRPGARRSRPASIEAAIDREIAQLQRDHERLLDEAHASLIRIDRLRAARAAMTPDQETI